MIVRMMVESMMSFLANERCVSILVSEPKLSSFHPLTKSDHEPRGSFGSQNSYALKMTWHPRTMLPRFV